MVDKIYDPVSGVTLQIFAYNPRTEEIYECNIPKIIADVRKEFVCTEDEAISKLAHSHINKPVVLTDVEVWAE